MSISTKDELCKKITLKSYEEMWFLNHNARDLSFLVPTIFENSLNIDSIRTQFVPNARELDDSVLTDDPEEEREYTVVPRLVHRYKNRVAFTITDKCFGYCRHCFRRRFTSNSIPCTDKELEDVCCYIQKHKELEEILITGGDPLTLSNSFLKEAITEIRKASPNIILRLCTRALCVNPVRFDDELLSIMKDANTNAPLFLMCQFNSPFEFNEQTKNFAKKISDSGIAMFNQSVLLKGVNDNVETLVALSYNLLHNRIKPYYIFIPDEVKGTEHLWVSLDKALKLEKELHDRVSGLEMPTFVKDLPEGGGKVNLLQFVMHNA